MTELTAPQHAQLLCDALTPKVMDVLRRALKSRADGYMPTEHERSILFALGLTHGADRCERTAVGFALTDLLFPEIREEQTLAKLTDFEAGLLFRAFLGKPVDDNAEIPIEAIQRLRDLELVQSSRWALTDLGERVAERDFRVARSLLDALPIRTKIVFEHYAGLRTLGGEQIRKSDMDRLQRNGMLVLQQRGDATSYWGVTPWRGAQVEWIIRASRTTADQERVVVDRAYALFRSLPPVVREWFATTLEPWPEGWPSQQHVDDATLAALDALVKLKLIDVRKEQ